MNKLYLIGIALFVSACALSPQEIKVNPTLSDTVAVATPDSSPFNVKVIDQRETNVLGKRGGVYKETATVMSDEEMVSRLQQTLTERFTAAGYTIDDLTGNQLYVMIDNLNYEAIGENRVSEVTVAAQITATAATGAGNFSKKYKASHKQQVIKAPDDDKNAELVNNVFGAVIQRVLSDEELLQYLNN